MLTRLIVMNIKRTEIETLGVRQPIMTVTFILALPMFRSNHVEVTLLVLYCLPFMTSREEVQSLVNLQKITKKYLRLAPITLQEDVVGEMLKIITTLFSQNLNLCKTLALFP